MLLIALHRQIQGPTAARREPRIRGPPRQDARTFRIEALFGLHRPFRAARASRRTNLADFAAMHAGGEAHPGVARSPTGVDMTRQLGKGALHECHAKERLEFRARDSDRQTHIDQRVERRA